MEKWQWTCLILCAFGLLKELRPSEPFVTEYIINYKNVTSDQLIHIAFPVSTYTSLGTLAIVFLVTDFLLYRSVVIFEGFAYVVTWIILIWGRDLTAIIFVEIFYGIACSTEVAYYTYIYAKVDRKHYKKVTSYTSSAILVGKFLGGVVAQILISSVLLNYHELNYVSLACVSAAFTISVFLPRVKKSIYFYQDIDSNPTITTRVSNAYEKLWRDFKSAFSDPYVLKWSIWWALASAGQYQVINYIQALWERIEEESESTIYNGAVKAIHTLLSAFFSFGVGYVKLEWSKWGEGWLSFISIIQGIMLVWMAVTNSLFLAYTCYIIFRTIHPVMMTIASAEVAQGIREESHGLIFGVNTFLALVIQTILTIIVSDAKGLALNERNQYLVYGVYFVALGIIFMFVTVHTACCNRNTPPVILSDKIIPELKDSGLPLENTKMLLLQ